MIPARCGENLFGPLPHCLNARDGCTVDVMSDRETHQRHTSQSTGSGPAGPSFKDAEALWRTMAQEHGLYTITEAAHRLGFGHGHNLRATRLTGKGRVLAVRRGDTFRYPGFQFDEPSGRALPAVKDVVRRGRWAGWTDEQVALWFYAPNRLLQGKRPVDVRGDEEKLISTAEADITG